MNQSFQEHVVVRIITTKHQPCHPVSTASESYQYYYWTSCWPSWRLGFRVIKRQYSKVCVWFIPGTLIGFSHSGALLRLKDLTDLYHDDLSSPLSSHSELVTLLVTWVDNSSESSWIPWSTNESSSSTEALLFPNVRILLTSTVSCQWQHVHQRDLTVAWRSSSLDFDAPRQIPAYNCMACSPSHRNTDMEQEDIVSESARKHNMWRLKFLYVITND